MHLRLRFQNLGKPRTAGLCGRAARISDCGPLFCYIFERPSPLEKPSCKVRFFVQKRSRKYRPKVAAASSISDHLSSRFSISRTNGLRLLSQTKASTHSPSPTGSHTTAHTAKQGAFRMGGGITTLGAFRTFTNIPGPGIRTASFAAFGAWSGVLPKNTESLRNSDALMRVAVPRRRGPAGLRRPTPPAERTVLAPISPRVQLCLRRPAFPLSAFIPGA